MVAESAVTRIAEASRDLEEETVAILREMVRTRSVNPPGEYEEIHELLDSTFQEYGWETETVWAPDELLRELGIPVEYPRPNLLATVTDGDGPTFVLNAHMDTVPVDDEDEWDYDPFEAEIDDGHVYGRGTHDSKGRIAAYVLASRILQASGMVPEDAEIVLAITVDEETGGQAGPEYLVENEFIEPDYTIVEGNCDGVFHAGSGVFHYEVTVTGKAAHAGVDLENGANALRGTNRILDRLFEYSDSLAERTSDVDGVGGPTCTPATIEGGIKTNVVPGRCSFTVDQRVPPDYDAQELELEFLDTVYDVTLPEGVDADVEILLEAESYVSDPTDELVRTVTRNASRVFDREVPAQGLRGFTDARFFADASTTVINFGPGDDDSNPHSANENISIDQVYGAARVIAESIVDVSE